MLCSQNIHIPLSGINLKKVNLQLVLNNQNVCWSKVVLILLYYVKVGYRIVHVNIFWFAYQ